MRQASVVCPRPSASRPVSHLHAFVSRRETPTFLIRLAHAIRRECGEGPEVSLLTFFFTLGPDQFATMVRPHHTGRRRDLSAAKPFRETPRLDVGIADAVRKVVHEPCELERPWVFFVWINTPQHYIRHASHLDASVTGVPWMSRCLPSSLVRLARVHWHGL